MSQILTITHQSSCNNASYTVDIPEDVTLDDRAPINALRVSTTDDDIGVNAQVTYSLAPDTRSEFQIQNTSSDIRISLKGKMSST